MNGLERDYSGRLEARRLAGEIQTWRFEEVKFRLGRGAVYTPDFEVVLADGTLEYHEVKGRWMEAARVRIKVAASRFSDRRFVVVKRPRKNGPWEFEEIRP